jgi:predicted AAA+ superfamily ATPase
MKISAKFLKKHLVAFFTMRNTKLLSPKLVDRDVSHPEVSNLSEILAVAGPRRSGKTFFFFQIIRDLIEKQGVAVAWRRR